MADTEKKPQPPLYSEPEKTPESEKNLDRDGGERHPTEHSDKK
jgi:hypothetical protein